MKQRHWQHWTHKTEDENKDTGNIGHTKQRMKTNKATTKTQHNTEN
jgi:hypothetical protein